MRGTSQDRLLGTVVDGWSITDKLGVGAMGVVYKARRGNDLAAIKVALPHTLSPDSLERFRREAHMMMGLNHPHVVRCHQAGEAGDFIYLALEYMPGGSLQDVLDRLGRLTVPQAVAVIRRVLSGLSAVHERGILHRDLKPDNVLLDAEGRPKLTDFGLARADRHARITGAGMILGTVEYMSPEQIDLQALDARSDLYAAGAMLFHLVAGQAPYSGKTGLGVLQQHRKAPVPSISKLAPEAKPLEPAIERLMAKRRSDRPQSAREALALFEGLEEAPLLEGKRLRSLEEELAATRRPQRAAPPPSRRLDAVAAVALLLAAGVAVDRVLQPAGVLGALPPDAAALVRRLGLVLVPLAALLGLDRLLARSSVGSLLERLRRSP